jgi:hypothetical protein
MKTYDVIYFPEDIADGYLIDEIHDRDKLIVELYDSLVTFVTDVELARHREVSDTKSARDTITKCRDFVKVTRNIHGL